MEKYSKCLGRLAHGGCLVSVVCSEGTDDGKRLKLKELRFSCLLLPATFQPLVPT